MRNLHFSPWFVFSMVVLVTTSLFLTGGATVVSAAPSTVTIAGDLQHLAGCPGDWDPTCAATHLGYDASDDVWQGTFNLPAGSYQYKATLDDSWAINYGRYAVQGGANVPTTVAAAGPVKFYYDDKSHWVTDNQRSVIATVPGDFQSKLGCPGDWDPGCLRSWLEDPGETGVYSFDTTALPAGSYQAKVALDESWNVNYGQGGVQNGPNIPFTVTRNNQKVTFRYDSTTHILSIIAGHAHDNNVEWNGLAHDSRNLLYRTPGGAVPAGTPVKLRFRTFHDDVTSVTLRLYDLNAGAQSTVGMALVASDVSCYDAALANDSCDYWQATVASPGPNNYWYRFIVRDGTSTAYYADNTPALDGGLGAPSSNVLDYSWALMFYNPGFTAPKWMASAVIYQIFPDRFRNGIKSNDPKTGDPRYDDPVIALKWGDLPEGYCRNYSGTTAQNCPWRFDPTQTGIEQPRGRDYYGGDLKGVTQELDYLQSLGVNTIYFNPIFYAKSNHRYDTADYKQIDPYLGTLQDFSNLVNATNKRGMHIILDGVYNHMSSDSPNFDRYHHYTGLNGACENAASSFRNWFYFRPPSGNEPSPCVPSTPGGNDTYYTGWFGFDSIPVLNKSLAAVQSYFLTGTSSVSKYWLQQGASGWRLDVMGDSSFPDGYWEQFRQIVKAQGGDNVIIGELWQKDSTLLRFLRGDRADSTMNYRLRDALLAWQAPQNFDSKGFADGGKYPGMDAVAARLLSIREDYPDAAYYSLMNLIDSHDTERALWTLTPGQANRTDREFNAQNLAAGKLNLEIATMAQFSMGGAPTIYYGDEVGMTGDTDPDDRRTYPWPDLGGKPDNVLLQHYQALATLHTQNPALVNGDFRVLLTDENSHTLAFGRKTGKQAAIFVGGNGGTFDIPVAGYLPNGVTFNLADSVNNSSGKVTVANGKLHVALANKGALLYITPASVDLTPPPAPNGLAVTNEGNGQVSLSWNPVTGAVGYNVYQSPVSGGGYVQVNTALLSSPRLRVKLPASTGTTFTGSGLTNAQKYYFVVTAVDNPGNESKYSNEVSALPHYTINWANTQWPPSIIHKISVVTPTATVYGQVYIPGVTNQPGQTPSLRAQLGFGPHGTNPAGNAQWKWVEAAFNVDSGNNDEFKAQMLPDTTGDFDYLYRYTTTDGRDWLYADLNGPVAAGALPANPGRMTVSPSGDTTPPAAPTGLTLVNSSPTDIDLSWTAVSGDPTMYGYEVLRSSVAGGPYTTLALVTTAAYDDNSVAQGSTYYYVVRAVDLSYNRSGYSNEVQATANPRTVTVVFSVTVPTYTDASGKQVFIAGTLSRLNGNLPDWNPGGVVLTKIDATHWTVTLTGAETTQIEYKYALGDWNYVEKDASCGEINNRTLTLTYGTTGTQTVNDTVQAWRNSNQFGGPCGN